MKVLIADDQIVTLRLLEMSVRRWGYDVIVAKDGHEALQILLSPDAPKLAILDWMMPGMDGTQLCQEVRRNKPEPYTYILLLTGKRTSEDVIAGLDAGADDYVTKPFEPAELQVRLRTGKRILFLQEQLLSAREAIRDHATHDRITGLWNPPGILEILSSELVRALRQAVPVAVVLAELDGLKQISDAHGDAARDDVLRGVSKAMRDSVRRYDSVGRYGSEEFLIVLPGCDRANAVGHAERIRAAVAQVVFETAQGKILPTMSLGVAVSDNQTGPDGSDLIQAADAALQRARQAGQNRVEFATTAELAVSV